MKGHRDTIAAGGYWFQGAIEIGSISVKTLSTIFASQVKYICLRGRYSVRVEGKWNASDEVRVKSRESLFELKLPENVTSPAAH